MTPVTIKATGSTLTYDDQQLSIKHRGLGTVTTHLTEIWKADFQQPGFLKPGKLQLVSHSTQHEGIMPKQPLTVVFSKKQTDQMQTLYNHVMAAKGRR